jgi:hypothetical protein
MFFGPIVLSVALLAFWTALGWSLIALAIPRARPLQALFLAPVSGAAITLLAVFWLNLAMPVSSFARPLFAVLCAVTVAAWIWRRPSWTRGELIFFLPVVVAIIAFGLPSFRFGFDWMANANDDWANYNLSALRLLNNSFFQQPSIEAMKAGRDYPGFFWFMNVPSGTRAGSDMLLAWVSGVTGKSPFFVFMPLILVFHALLCFAAAALAMASLRRGVLFAALILTAMAPLNLFAVHQQLIAQVFGLALMCATASLTFVSFNEFKSKGRIAVTSIVVAAFCLAYPEALPFFVLAFIVFHALHGWTVGWGWKHFWRVLFVPAITCALLGPYSLSFLFFLLSQFHGSADKGVYDDVSVFPYFLVPNGLSVLFGFSRFGELFGEPFLSVSIAAALIMVAVVISGLVIGLKRRHAVSIYLLILCIVAAALLHQRNDYGLFKVAMFSQAFIWFAVVLIVSRLRFAAAVTAYALILCAIFTTDFRIGLNSFEDKTSTGDLLGASRNGLLTMALLEPPKDSCDANIESANPPLLKILSATPNCARSFVARPYLFVGWVPDAVNNVERIPSLPGVKAYTETAGQEFAPNIIELPFPGTQSNPVKTFKSSFASFSRWADVWPMPSIYYDAAEPRTNRLILLSSNLGSYYYLPDFVGKTSLFEVEQDIFFLNGHFAAAGRYLLFRVEHPTKKQRLLLDLTTTIQADGKSELPPATVAGETRVSIGLEGHGAARVLSPPFAPLVVDGVAYALLDLGAEAHLMKIPRSGLMGLYGRSVPLDYRRVVAFIRKIRAVDSEAADENVAPSRIANFPADLSNPNLQFSGIYEDGWVGNRGFVTLFSVAPGKAIIRGMVPGGIGIESVELTMAAGNSPPVKKLLKPGSFEIETPVEGGETRIHFEFSDIGRLPSPDTRPAVALLSSVSIELNDSRSSADPMVPRAPQP